ncbi:MAG: sugar ABC transporter substrate-binding protein [Spirochaetia bacterium]
MGRKRLLSICVVLVLAAGFALAGGQQEGAGGSGEAEGPVTIKVWNWSQENKDFFDMQAEAFEAEHPNINVVFETFAQDQYQQTLPLSLRSGEAADIFWLSPEMSAREYINQGWIQPVGDGLSEDFLGQFDDRLFVEGIMRYDGEIYTLPFENRFVKLHGLLYYNKTVFEMAGLDPETDMPDTFSEFREVCRQITEAGDGQYYGISWPGVGNGLERPLQGWLTTAAPASGDIRYGRPGYDYRDGEFKLANDNHLEVYRLLKGLVDDGSVAPGWSSMKKEPARALFGQDRVAFHLGGTWMPRVWGDMGFEDVDFGIAYVPVPDGGRRSYRYMSLAKGSVFLSAQTEKREAALEVYRWLHSADFQQANFSENGVFPGNQTVDTSDATWFQQRFLEIADEVVMNHPEPVSQNPATAQVEWPSVQRIGEVFAAALAQDEDYFLREAATWDEAMAEQLERNIERAQSEGVDVTMDDFIFPDWDPMENYY